jgi:hypothetical protein
LSEINSNPDYPGKSVQTSKRRYDSIEPADVFQAIFTFLILENPMDESQKDARKREVLIIQDEFG